MADTAKTKTETTKAKTETATPKATKTKAAWEPRKLVHPDGEKTWTPESRTEETDLVRGAGWTFADDKA